MAVPGQRQGIVGRERELELIEGLLAAPATWPRTLVIEGEPGAGKTALWTAGVAASPYLVLRARPSGAEAKLAFAGLGDLLEPVAADALPALPAPQRRALEAALLLGEDPEPRAEPRAVGVAVLAVLRRVAAAAPLVIGVDDEQWLDAPSAEALGFALRRLEREPVLTLLARRSGGVVSVVPALERDRVESVTAGPLGLDAIRVLLQRRLGLSWSRPALVRVREASGGNPLYAIELARALVHQGGEAGPARPLPVPATLADLLSDRLARLPPVTLDTLAIAAALRRPTAALVNAVAGRDAGPELAAAATDGVVELDEDRIAFAHPLLAVAAQGHVSAGRRRDIHRRIAGVAEEPEERAMHLALAADGPDEGIARELSAAARRAHGRGASLAAAELAEQARRLTPAVEAARARERSLASADYSFAAGATDAARAILEGGLGSAPAGEARAEVLVRLALLDTFDGELANAHSWAAAALAESVTDPELRIVLHRRLSVIHLLLAELAGAEEHAESALRLAQALGRPGLVAQATASLAFVRALRGRPVAAEALERVIGADARVAGQASIDDSPLAVKGLLRMYAADYEEARGCFDACIADAVDRGDESSLAGLLFCSAELECRTGRFPEADRLAERALEASSQTAQRLTRAVSLFVKGMASAHLGRADEARAAAEEGMAIARRAGHRFAEAQNCWVLGLLDLSLGRFADSSAAFGRILAFVAEAGIEHEGVLPVGADAVEALLGAGDVDTAEALLARLGPSPSQRRAAALVSAARGDLTGAGGTLEEALAAARSDFEAGRTLLALGQVRRRAKRKAPAREAIVAARARFRDCGARLWADAAEAELARVGGRPPRSSALTPTEQRVAQLVASGRSNKEVAAALFVTVGTVEAHLSRIYAKLGVRSRAQLAAREGAEQSVGVSGVSAAPPQP